jgi:hypothetical protein
MGEIDWEMSTDEEQYDDDFGYMQFNEIDAWDCNVSADFPHAPTYYFAIHIWGDESGPSELQRKRIRWLKREYSSLWPEIAETICNLHPDLKKASQVAAAMRDWVLVHLGQHGEESVEIVYDLDLPDEGNRGFFISVSDLGITKAFVAD